MKIDNSNLDSSDLSSCEEAGIEDDKSIILDQDHRLLLRNAKPLFQSRNAAVNNMIKKKCQKIVYFHYCLVGGDECCSTISSFSTKIRSKCYC